MFALALYLVHDDVMELAAEAITDGDDDKKLDFCLLDESSKRLVLGQAYTAVQWGRDAAPANKASDLNTAVAWLLNAEVSTVPERLRPLTTEVREALKEGRIETIEILYVHNCHESVNVQTELNAVRENASHICQSMGGADVSVSAIELGLEKIQELYDSFDKDIKVEEVIEIPIDGADEAHVVVHEGEGWRSVVLSVDGLWLKELFVAYQDELFSANVRDFLGVTRRAGNVNAGIKQSAASEPGNFWAYNNGITALTHEFEVESTTVRARGISIINGAQTTGALAEADDNDLRDVRVLCRLVESRDKGLIRKIVLFNNTQNVIRPSDLRSNHPVQKRLEAAFSEFGIRYVVRRSGRAPHNSVSAESVAPSLCAFHGDPITAARQRREIFESDTVFDRVFPGNISAGHVYLVYCLAAAFDRMKLELKEKNAAGTATFLETQQYDLLRYSPSRQFVLFLVGSCAEELLGRRVSAIVDWRATSATMQAGWEELTRIWTDVLRRILPLAASALQEGETGYDLTRSKSAMVRVSHAVKGNLAALAAAFESQLRLLRDKSAV
ncbi:MAG: AIPR family protein [Phycisphaerales bacterium]